MVAPTAPSDTPQQTWRSIAETPFKAAVLPDRLWRMATAEFEETPYEIVHAENKVRLRRYEPFLDRVPSDDTAVIEFPTGHVGLSVEPEAHAEGWPKVCDWLEARS